MDAEDDDREGSDGDADATDAGSAEDEPRELSDLDPNAEEAARKVDRQLRRLRLGE
ncbi:hypothetical protein NGM10_05550 [Halorussus salilacus]|uniref:hypothetical protein n=1 Tax=Halorussus salilacus TaxID=2953750 RepID=UPI0020A22D8D|nr:hypothetical protein [Halorussus salilacus]USZ69204.1 hypothetical protein NGM10_05550 [Halorussus salilacus]